MGTPVRARDAEAHGIPRSRLRADDVAHPFRGVHVVGANVDGIEQRARAFAPLLGPADAFSHTTAAALYGAQLPRAIERDLRLHVTTIGTGNRFRRRGLVGHRTEEAPVILWRGLPMVDPAHTWVQLATMLGNDDLVAVGDRWVTPQGGPGSEEPALTSIAALVAALASHPGARGARRARRAIESVRVGPASRMETLLRLLLVRSGLPEPEVAPAVAIGHSLLHPDLMYPQWGVVLEYEGDHHRTDARQWRHDIWRREAFESAGLRVIRVHRDDLLAEPEAFLARVCHILAQRGRSSTGSSGG